MNYAVSNRSYSVARPSRGDRRSSAGILPFIAELLAIVVSLSIGTLATAEENPFEITLTSTVQTLPYKVKDADFSTALNAIVTISESPAQLHIYDPDTLAAFDVNLPLNPTCISVSPDGLDAVVGHNAWVSVVDLSSRSLVKSIPVSANVVEVVHGGNGYAYAFSTDYYVRSINLATEVVSQRYLYRRPMNARLHPERDRIYGADTLVSPDDIMRVNIGAGPASSQFDSRYHGEYSMCGNVWISKDGLRLVTGCGNTFRTSSDASSDMLFGGKLSQETRITWAEHSSFDDTIMVLPAYTTAVPRIDNEIHFYSHNTLRYMGKATLPAFVSEPTVWPSRGRFLFVNAYGTKKYVVVQADAAAGLVNDFGVVTIDCTDAAVLLDRSSDTIDASAQSVQIGVTGVAACAWKVSSDSSWIRSVAGGIGDATLTLDIDANTSSERTGTVAVGNVSFTLTQAAASVPSEPAPANRVWSLPFRVIDAEYSKPLDAIIGLADSPNSLKIYRPASHSVVSVPLSSTAYAVSVGPDGMFAAVGHDHAISYVDLQNASVVKTLAVSSDVFDIVLGGNGYVYVFPRTDQWESIRCVNVATGVETNSGGYSIYAATTARLHPGGKWIYGADTTLSPSDIEKYDISNGTAKVLYDSPYHGDYPMCGKLWFSEDGNRIYTGCGNVFRATSEPATDMTYAGTFAGESRVRWASHSQAASAVAVLPDYYYSYGNPPRLDHELHYYAPDFLNYLGKFTLPLFYVEGVTGQARGRWHFFNSSGMQQYVVVQVDESSGILHDFGVASIDCSNAKVSMASTSASFGASGGSVNVNVTGTEGCVWKALASAGWISTFSAGAGDGILAITVSENRTAAPRSGTVKIGAETFSISQGSALPPSSISAAAASSTAVSVSWSAGPADQFEVWRYSASGGVRLGTTTTKTYMDTTVGPNAGYVYRVRALYADGSASSFVTDYAHTFAISDPSLVGSAIRAVHMTELRAIVNALRAAAGQPSTSFTDPSLVGVTAKRAHVLELHSAIDSLRSSLGLAPYGFAETQPMMVIFASTTEELRAALR
ncbi:MAG: BACON domain-containing protein [Acidobacteria bacterium]|nr:BACON domain-containing protein [Acidobacteriota bacterium]